MNPSGSVTPSQVTGEVIIEEAGRSFSGATVFVHLEDTSRADAPSQTVAEQIIPDISHTSGTATRLPFSLPGVIPDDRNRYSVRVHVDVDGNGQVSRGDFLSVASYPVLTFGHPESVTVTVKELMQGITKGDHLERKIRG